MEGVLGSTHVEVMLCLLGLSGRSQAVLLDISYVVLRAMVLHSIKIVYVFRLMSRSIACVRLSCVTGVYVVLL